MLRLAEDRINLQPEQEKIIVQKILNYLYNYIYYLPINKNFKKECRRLEKLEGLQEYLGRYRGRGEQTFVSKMVLKKKYHLLKSYFCVRHILGRVLWRRKK